jgi:Zn-dependent metalloprotease
MGRLRSALILLLTVLSVMGLNQYPASAQSPRTLDLTQAQAIGLNYLEQHLQEYGLSSPADLQVGAVSVDRLSMAHVRMQQLFGGIRVFGGEGIVHLSRDGSVLDVTDHFIKQLQVDLKRQRLTAKQAIKAAIAASSCRNCSTTAQPPVELWILRRDGRDYLVYRVQLQQNRDLAQSAVPIYFIDACTGKTIWTYHNLQT